MVPQENPKLHLKSIQMNELLEYDEEHDKFYHSVITDNNTNQSEVLKHQGLTTLDLLSVVVPFTIADATCDISYHRSHMAENIQAFGQKGADNVQKFKSNYLKEYQTRHLAAYKLEEPFVTDLNELKVTLGFECLIQGHEGKGTEIVYLSSDKLVTKIVAVRSNVDN